MCVPILLRIIRAATLHERGPKHSEYTAPFPAVTIPFRSFGLLEYLLYLLIVLLAEIKGEQPLVIRYMAGIARPCTSASHIAGHHSQQ